MIDKLILKIFEILDQSTLLGAALDCMSDEGKKKIHQRLERVLREAITK